MKQFRCGGTAGLTLILVFLLGLGSLGQDANSDSNGGDDSGSSASAPEASQNQSVSEAGGSKPAEEEKKQDVLLPLITLVVGIAIVLGLIIGWKVNAFIALITAAMVVSLMAPGEWSGKIGRVATAFGNSAGGIAIVIAMAAVIGKCMLDSGAADRIVRAFMNLLGEKGAPFALMGSGFVLAVPVFFDTVFYLLVPLARSLHRSTKKNYLMYIMAIGAGGAITHTLVPPTPGPLMMASNLGFDVGMMIMIGSLVALPAALVGGVVSGIIDRKLNVPMRQIGSEPDPDPLKDEELPSLIMSLLPVLLPVVLIAANTVLTTIADNEHAAALKVEHITDLAAFRQQVREESQADQETPGKRIVDFLETGLGDEGERKQTIALIQKTETLSSDEAAELIQGLNDHVLARKKFHRKDDEKAFLGIYPNKTAQGLLKQGRERMKKPVVERMNRSLLESAYPDHIEPHVWKTQARKVADISALFGNANLVLLLSTVIALWLVVKQRGLSKIETANLVETSLMSGGVIILITAGGGAFGAMLKQAQIGTAIQSLFSSGDGGESGKLTLLFLAFLLGSLLKIAQGSGTVSMIVGTSMMAAIVAPIDLSVIHLHPVYIACAVGAGSCVCSWMNDSGFWIFAKMGGLTEVEALKSWTIMLVVLGFVSFATTVLLSFILPLA